MFQLLFSRPLTFYSLRPHGLEQLDLPVHHHLPKFAQVHVHCIGDAIQISHPLTPSFPSALVLKGQEGPYHPKYATQARKVMCVPWLF